MALDITCRSWMLVYVVVVVGVGAIFLPGGVRSDSIDSRTQYSVYNPRPYGETDGIAAYEFVPLSREKRQVPATKISITPQQIPPIPIPSQPPPATTDPVEAGKGASAKLPTGMIWANKTSTPVVSSVPSGSASESTNNRDNPLFRTSITTFTNNTSSPPDAEKGTQVSFGNDTAYPNGSWVDVPDFPLDSGFGEGNTKDAPEAINYTYYNVSVYPPPIGSTYWIDLNQFNATKHQMLSNAHRRAATLTPTFEFMFYGHKITNLTVATGGFIYLGDQVHAWLAATQYVAPLMANFESTANGTNVSFYDSGEYFTVEWEEVILHDAPDKGNFTFQTTLHKNGTIVFAYKHVAFPIDKINDTQHPVKVGLSDAYIRDKNLLVVKQKTIYEYHRIDLKNYAASLVSGSAMVFTLADTCVASTTCEDCMAEKAGFDCVWCPVISKCSNGGLDRNRQTWMQNSCEKDDVYVKDVHNCAAKQNVYNYSHLEPPNTGMSSRGTSDKFINHADQGQSRDAPQVEKIKTHGDSSGNGGVIAIMFFIVVVFGSIGWLAYAYFYPHSPSGQLLIRYRPTRWAFRRGEARYTAASIHM